MKKINVTLFAVVLSTIFSSAVAQQSYPKDLFEYALECSVPREVKSPKIGDFVNVFLSLDETSEILGTLQTVWNHYLRHEPQEPCYQFTIDEKNGYVQYTFNSQLCDDFNDDDVVSKSTHEMCYWNCADGKHKLIAENYVVTLDGKYINGQYDGICFFLYDNATHEIYPVCAEDIGAYVDPVIDESNFETGEQMTMNDETVRVHRLPKQGKDIEVEIYSGTRKTVTRLVWNGMRFKQQ